MARTTEAAEPAKQLGFSPEDLKRIGKEFGLSPLELARIVEMPEASHLSSLSADTWRRRYPHLIHKISPNREGIRVGHALLIGAETRKAKQPA